MKAAWIGAIAGSLAAAVISGIFTVVTVSQQVHAEDRRAAAEFLRPEQKAIYAEFISTEEQLREAESVLTERIYDETPSSELGGRTGEVWSAIEKLVDKQSTIKLVGSPEMVEKAAKSVSAHRKHLSNVVNLLQARPNDRSADGALSEAVRVVSESEEALRTTADEFVDQARVDLGAEAIPTEGGLDY